MINNIPTDWKNRLNKTLKQPYIEELETFLLDEYATKTIYPKQKDIFKALELTSFNDVSVVILGQDPYHGPNQAHGLSFSVLPGAKTPPSLANIYKELADDLQVPIPTSGNLSAWAEQGVLLLNTVLTVQEGKAHSHKNKGWEQLTDEMIRQLSLRETPVIFVLWGKPAQKKKSLINTEKHHIIEAPHPSPLSSYRGFFGSKPFSKINHLLIEQHRDPIMWHSSQ